nr:molybdenum cofactor biosynthesis protein MoaE [Cyanobium sp. LEGE 06113]
MSVELSLALRPQPFDPLHHLEGWQRAQADGPRGASAAEAWFIGRVRGHDGRGEPLEALELEHYPGMTEHCLRSQAEQLGRHHGANALLVQHRVGRVRPGEAIVLVAVAADRRGPAQRCCQALLEALKHDAPFWKREWLRSGESRWVEGNTAF